MPIKRIPSLTGGTNEIANPENLNDDQLQDSSNYEPLGDGMLHRRKEPMEYGNDVSGDSLKTQITAKLTSILQISPPYYPVKKLSDMTGDFIILMYGLATAPVDSDFPYELYMCYENDTNTWTVTQVAITGIGYTSNTYLEFFVGDDKMIITDTYNLTENFPHYVKVDADGELITGLFSIKAPTNKATMQPVTEYNEEDFEEDATGTYLDECGIVQCVYTVVTKEGDESNPSPISNSRMMQFFKKDLTDKNDERWIDNFLISNLSVPPLTGDLVEQLKYFYVYFRVIRYSEGEGAEPFYFSQRFDIVDKDNTVGDTGNGYLVTVPQDESILVSYENDIAPYAKHAAETSGIVGFANIREKIRFPYDFEKYCTIDINNVNNKNFVDAIVYIRIYDADNVGTLDYDEVQVDMIADLDLSYYDGGGVVANLDLIRIYDDDLTTPIKVVYYNYAGGHYIDVYAKIPLLVAGQLKHLYLCFNTATGTAEGVNVDEHKTFEYGQFTQLTADNVADFFDTERVKSNKTVICSPMDYMKGSEVLNLADDNNPGEIINDNGEWEALGTKQYVTRGKIGTGRYILRGNSDGFNFTEIRYSELPFDNIPDRVTMWGRIIYTNLIDALPGIGLTSATPFPIIAFYQSDIPGNDNDYKGIFLGVREVVGEDETKYCWCLYGTRDMTGLDGAIDSKYSYLKFDEILMDEDRMASGEVFICLSIDKDESASLFVGSLDTGSFYRQKVLWDAWDIDGLADDDEDEGAGWYFKDIDTFSIGFSELYATRPNEFSFKISQFQLMINKYYSAESDNDLTAIYNIANFMPSFETAVGKKIIIED